MSWMGGGGGGGERSEYLGLLIVECPAICSGTSTAIRTKDLSFCNYCW